MFDLKMSPESMLN